MKVWSPSVPSLWKGAVAGVAFAFVFSGAWGLSALFGEADPLAAALAAGITVLGFWWLLHALVRRAAEVPFRAKGRVLRGAEVRLNGVEALPSPVEEELPPDYDDPDDIAPFRTYRLDLAIEPKPSDGVFSLYDPWEILVVPPDFRLSTDMDGDGERGWSWTALELFEGGEFRPWRGDKLGQAARWRCTVDLPEDVRRVRLSYYFERVGPEIELP